MTKINAVVHLFYSSQEAVMAKQYDPYMERGQDGRITDARLKYGRDDRVRIVRGVKGGETGTVESLVAQMTVDGRSVTMPGYHVVLYAGDVITIKWDEVEGV